MYLTNLADVLRNAGLDVVETSGWRTRGHGQMTAVRGVLWHHTATSAAAAGDYPSQRVVTDGRSDLPGPLCNLGLGRSGTWYCVAAGQAWHAGAGSYPGIGTNGNPYLIGIEAEHPGNAGTPWPAAQLDSYRRGTAALLRSYGLGADRCIGHKEWAPRRKPDPISLDMNAERRAVAAVMANPNPNPPPRHQEDDMPTIPYTFDGTGRDPSGNLIERCHVLTIPVGSVSAVVEAAWLSFKCAIGPAESVRLMAISSGENAGYPVDQTWTDVTADADRPLIFVPSGCDQVTAFIKSDWPYSLGLEMETKAR